MRRANLSMILKELDPENISYKVSRIHDAMRELYVVQRITVQNFEEFMEEITKFYQHQFSAVISGGHVDVPDWIASGFAREIVDKAFSRLGGLEGAYMIASKGIEGGLRTVIDSIYKAIKEQQEEQYINHVLITYVDPLDWDDRIELMRQYLNRFGRSLPEGARIKSPEELAANYEEIIKLHMKALQSIRTRIAP